MSLGKKATPAQVNNYYRYRDIGLTVEDAARAVGGFSKAWGSIRDKQRRERERAERVEQKRAIPLASMTEVLDFFLNTPAEDVDADKARSVVPGLRGLVWALAHERAINLQCALEALFSSEPWSDDFEANPITAEEVVESTLTQRELDDDFAFWPTRIDTYIVRFESKYGTRVRDQIDEAMVRSPKTAEVLAELGHRMERGLIRSPSMKQQAISTNGRSSHG